MSTLHPLRQQSARSRGLALFMAVALCGGSGDALAQSRAVARSQVQPEPTPEAETQVATRVRGSSVAVTLPNGYAYVVQDDLTVESTGGTVRWSRVWDGQEWKFNPYWESLSQSWKNLTGSQTADTSGSAVAGTRTGTVELGSSNTASTTDMGGCWVWVDEDWTPKIGSVVIDGPPVAEPMAPERMTPFNRIMGEDEFEYAQPVRVSVDFASLCAGKLVSSGVRDLEGIRRQNELYLGEQGRYAFSNRAVLEKRAVQMTPELDASGLAQLSTGSFTLAPVTNAKGYRWIHKEGDWIDYNTQGQAVAYGDRNDNLVWIVRDQNGAVRGVVDAAGHVVYTLHYTGPLLTEVRDYPMAGNSLDLPARSVHYQYDGRNRLTQVTDVRGYTIRYGYDDLNRVVSVTDQEGRIERFEYNGDTVAKRIAPDGTVTEYLFEYDDANKQFTSKITGPDTSAGRRVEDYTHNRSGKPVRTIVNGRIEEEVRYDTGARAELHTNARGFVTRITHNEFDQVVRVDHPDGTSQQRSYSALHLQLTEEIDEAGIRTQYQYDAKGNLRKRIDAVGTPAERTIDYDVNALGQTTHITVRGRTEANGTVTADSTWTYEYDSKGQLSKAIDPEGDTRLYVYNRVGALVRYTDPRSNATRYEVDAHGDLTRATDALNRSDTYTYDRVGNVLTFTNARGNAIQVAYDAMNRRTEITSPVDGVWRIQYNGQGLPVAETDADGHTERAEFDPFLRLTRQIDAIGNVTEYSYLLPDGGGGTVGSLHEPTEIRYPTFTERQRYDQRERPTNQILLNTNQLGTEGLVSSSTYDKRGRIATYTDENGKTSSYAYDAFDRIIEATDSLGNKTTAIYDVRGNLLQIRDPKGNVNRFEYDRNNRLIKEVLPLGQTTVYRYDPAGNLAEQTDPNGHRAEYEHDAANRFVVIRRYRSSSTLVCTTTLTWDDADNLTAWTDIDATRPSGQQTTSSSATYDRADNKTAETITYPTPQGGSYSLAYEYQYSLAGYKTRLKWPDGTAIDYGYTAHGELESVAIPGEGTISVNQFKWFVPERITLPGGATQTRSYDSLLNLEELKVRTPGQQSVLEIANAYGKLRELTSSARIDTAGGVSSGVSGAYTYDDEVRLTRAVTDRGGVFGNDTDSFTLDAVGNRIAHSKVTGAWTYDANNRLLQRGTGANATSYEYDDAGNLTRKTEPGNRITQYVYDAQSRLTEVRDAAGNPIARYGYDIVDARLWKEQYRDRNGAALAQPKRTYYLYADEGLIAEAEQAITLHADGSVTANPDVNGGQPAIVTQYGPQPDAEFTTGTLFIKTTNSNGATSVAYFHNDQLGTPLAASDRSGNVIWAANYNVFGEATITTPVATVDKPTITSNLRLPGQYADDESGLHYTFRRYYDPSTGRFITQDPIGYGGGDNLYRYADADPVNRSDPTGECPQCAAYAICFAACMLEDAATNAITGECNNFGDSAKNCALSCALGMGLGKLWKWGKKLWDRMPCSVNSFPTDTPVHVRPAYALAEDAQSRKTVVKTIGEIEVGDEVLAFSQWKEQGGSPSQDGRLSYEKVTDVFSSFKQQVLVHLSLDNGETLTVTEGHPFLTVDGWRDAVQLRIGDKVLRAATASERTSAFSITAVEREVSTLPVINLEVANAHTYFVGDDGALVHNACLRRPYIRKWVREQVEKLARRTKDGRPIDPNTRKPINGKPDFGHKPGHENWREVQKAEREGLTQKEFNDRMNDPKKYQLEDPSSNRSRRYEKP